ncbi:MAG: tRNA (guanosine(18)-2'-O)-methyltransferase [Chlamydiia bacterium]|nr:tRNA (guanosine(18)-2'-O)-methyltransferase [Chlamydiia bacterium]MCH9616056.1 tRNA (guanosine(18)-2'-O)-methyltransferase [Chlamydiia bacterium]MCH9629079.1 tRNA (guanosine(18)-2'-O)-methyltransferase [Chlamydiia bacterium]
MPMNIDNYTDEEVCKVLEPMLTSERKERIEEVLEKRCQSLQVAIEAPADVHNAYAVARTGEAFGLYQFHIIASEMRLKRPKSMVGVHRWVKMNNHDSMEAFKAKMGHVKLVGAEVQGELSLDEIDLNEPTCLLFGNEHRGLSKEALSMCDKTFRLPMVGMVESLNLSVAAAITLFRLRSQAGFRGDASAAEMMRLRALYYYKTYGYPNIPAK